MQFKRPAAYPDFSTSKIVTDRRKAGLTSTPHALYFPLRQKRETHQDFQHNVLLRLRQRLLNHGLGDAVYVCPLFLDRSAYRLNMHRSEEHTSELQSLMRNSYAVLCLKKKKQ